MILVVCGRWRTFGCVEVGKATVCGQGLSSHAVAGRWERSLWSTSRPVLSGRRSECQCHSPESGKKRKGRGQVHHHAPHRDQHTGTEFQQPFSQCPDLSRCARSCRCAARACGLGAWPAWPYASTPHFWPSPPHTRLLARHPETPATGDARIRHRDERECTLREESNGSTASVCAKSPPHRLPPSRCRDATRQRTDTVPPRH